MYMFDCVLWVVYWCGGLIVVFLIVSDYGLFWLVVVLVVFALLYDGLFYVDYLLGGLLFNFVWLFCSSLPNCFVCVWNAGYCLGV